MRAYAWGSLAAARRRRLDAGWLALLEPAQRSERGACGSVEGNGRVDAAAARERQNASATAISRTTDAWRCPRGTGRLLLRRTVQLKSRGLLSCCRHL